MLVVICPQYCPAPFCMASCPAGAVSVASKGKVKSICVETDKCNGCGICRMACMTWSRDKAFERKLPWITARAS